MGLHLATCTQDNRHDSFVPEVDLCREGLAPAGSSDVVLLSQDWLGAGQVTSVGLDLAVTAAAQRD
ncbi:hypothetical protein SAMN05216388_101775 [Halorientalis persicus]|uniref:Uncharacterized protein n=1 Tax=Halorientalis persicus TaxID=1367881 RepID=A0A1H8RYB2_9EURY|nr:hypothetical protein SAMN05216388_101775 [Halorientalis persicus]